MSQTHLNSLDPRINRLDEKKLAEGEVQTNSHLITYEGIPPGKTRQPVHAGVVHASTPEMALLMAKEQYGRRGKTANLWVVKTTDIYTFSPADEDIFETTPEKIFRDPGSYKVRDRIDVYRKKHAINQ